ncbi:MAG: NFACT RNA binding domain-containing protein [Tissierellia bacterium]|nr:NFACT RNA binding domain-containing protein [Tissierellia bacterium]
MSFDGSVVRALSHELNLDFKDGKIDKIYQPEDEDLVLHLRNGKNRGSLLLSASSSHARFYLSEKKRKNPAQAPVFCMLLRKHLEGARILGFDPVGMDRVLKIRCLSTNDLGDQVVKSLVIEVMGRHSNIILVDEETGRIIDAIKRINHSISRVRQVLPGLPYELDQIITAANPLEEDRAGFFEKLAASPEAQNLKNFFLKNYMGISPLMAREMAYRAQLDLSRSLGSLEEEKEDLFAGFSSVMTLLKNHDYQPSSYFDHQDLIAFGAISLSQYGSTPKKTYPTMSQLLDQVYGYKEVSSRFKQRRQALERNINQQLEKSSKKLSRLSRDLDDAKNREKYKVYGDLLSSYAWKVPRGVDQVELENFYQDMAPITIPLNKNISPNQNAGKYYKRYSKLKHADKVLGAQYRMTQSEINYLENALYSLDLAEDMEDLNDLYEEFNLDFLKKRQSKQKPSKKKKEDRQSKPYVFVTPQGDTFYVGRNSRQNDKLTLKFAAKKDYWFHVKEGPGSHVILKTDQDPVPQDLLYKGSVLAAHFSKQKMSTKVEVDYTQRAHVSRHPSKKKGLVIYVNYASLQVDPHQKSLDPLDLKIKS